MDTYTCEAVFSAAEMVYVSIIFIVMLQISKHPPPMNSLIIEVCGTFVVSNPRK